MSDDQAIDIQEALEAPAARLGRRAARRGRARPGRRDAPLGGARDGGGRARPLPRGEARDRAGHRQRLLLRLRAARGRSRPTISRPSRRAWRRASRRPIRSSGASSRWPRRGRLLAAAGQPYKVEILDDLAARAQAAGEACRRSPASTSTGRSVDLCKGPHVGHDRRRSARSSCSASPAPTGAATRSGRCSSGSTARSGRRRRSSTSSSGAARRRRSATTASSGCSLDLFSFHDVEPRRRLLAPEGLAALPDAARRHARAPGPARLRRGLHAAARPPEALGAVRPLGALPRQHVPRRGRGPDVQPQADELPGVDVHLPQPRAVVPRPAAAARRVRRAPPQRAVGRPVGPDPGPPLRDRRRPHLRPARPDRGRDRGADGGDPGGVLLVRADADADVRHAPGQGARRRRRLGRDRGHHARRARALRPRLPGEAQGRRLLRAEDRHPDHGRARARVADGDDPGRPGDAARSDSTSGTSTRRAASSARWRSTAPSTDRSNGSSAS